KLWGLVACHHYQGPKRPGILMRKGFQIYGDLIASKIIEINKLTQVVAQRNAMEFVHSLLNNLAISHDPQDTFKAKTEQLLALCRGTSALVKLGNQQVFMGQPIQAETLIALHNKLQSSDQFGVWHSHCLKDDLGLKKCDPHAAGALAVPLSCDYKDFVLWLRPEEVQENRWGGALSEPASGSRETKKILSPRQSFAEWQQKVFAQSRPWGYGDIESANFFLSSHVQECLARVQVLASAYKDLERQDKAKDQFISTASHELRTPLAIIQGWVGLLKDDTKHSPLAVKAIDIIERNLKAQSKLIEELLDSFRMKAGKLRISVQDNVDVRELISKVLDAIRPTLKTQDITLIWDPQAPVLMSVDPDRLTQIIWNILNNAQKFTPVGGQISVRLQKTVQTVIIEIEDTGIGIDPRFLDEIFECYVQDNTHANKAGGLGIGLSVVRSLTELHGGRVQALSAGLGHGARFKVELPCKNVSTAISASSAAPSNTPTLQNLRILIAEDQPDALLALSMLCERFGGIVTSAKNGAEALELLKSRQFDLILSDLSMPLLDGYELMKFWRLKEQEQKTPKIPAIAISAYTSPSDRVNSLEAGFNAHIGKPIYREELFAVIKSLKLIDLI
ncbi:MAG: ATP-binding protein, partial [Proteobacteria bacterium]|nr:ATP-binding protein [Pseudomonadota bacterium]